MAVKKKTSTKKAAPKKAMAKRKQSTAMVGWEEKLAAEAQAEAERTGASSGGGNFISIQGGKFKCQGEALGDELSVIVLNSVYAREYYDTKFDPEDTKSPACFNIAADVKDIIGPHPDAPNPPSQECDGCPKNEWGSADYGQSKACGSKVIFAIMDPDAIGDEDYQPLTLRAGVNSMLNWDAYVKGLAKRVKRPTYAVVTTMTFDDESAYPVLKFKMDRIIESKDAIEEIYSRRELLVDSMLEVHYDVDSYEPPSPNKKGGRKPALKKKSSSRFAK